LGYFYLINLLFANQQENNQRRRGRRVRWPKGPEDTKAKLYQKLTPAQRDEVDVAIGI